MTDYDDCRQDLIQEIQEGKPFLATLELLQKLSKFSNYQIIEEVTDVRIADRERVWLILMNGKKYFLTKGYVEKPFIRKVDEPIRRSRSFYLENNRAVFCGGKPLESDTICYASDNYTNKTLIRYLVREILVEQGLYNVSLLHGSSIVGNDTVSLYDYSDLGTFDDFVAAGLLDEQSAISIIDQALVTLRALNKYRFSHGALSRRSLLFTSRPFGENSDFTVEFTDMWKASIKVGKYYFFNGEEYQNLPIRSLPISQEQFHSANCREDREMRVDCITSSSTCSQTIPYEDCQASSVSYRLEMPPASIYKLIRGSGFPVFTGSFDFYCLFVSLMCDPNFYSVARNSSRLYSFWKTLWKREEFVAIEDQVRLQHQIRSQEQVFLQNQAVIILANRSLRCDIIENYQKFRLTKNDHQESNI